MSILTTCYNRSRHVAQAIESVLSQWFTDFELIIVDDASSDSSADAARGYAEKDPRVRVVVNERNLGDYPNRNRAARLARGEFIKYVDSDDLLYPHALSVMVPLMRGEPTAAIGISLIRRIPGAPAPMLLTPRMAYQREFLGAGLFMGGPGDAIIRRKEFLELGLFPESGGASDNLFWMTACARVNVLTLPADLTWHRPHQGQATHSRQAAFDAAGEAGIQWRALGGQECPLTHEEVEAARTSVVRRLIRELWLDMRRPDTELARYRLRSSGVSARDLVRYARGSTRDALAGTPVSAEGEYEIPEWVRFSSQSGTIALD